MCYYHLLPFRVIDWLASPQSRDVSARAGCLLLVAAQRVLAVGHGEQSRPLHHLSLLVLSFFLSPPLPSPLPKLRAPFCFLYLYK